MCIRPNGQLHVQLRPTGEVIFVPLTSVQVTTSSIDIRHMSLTREMGAFFTQLLTVATEELRKVEGFDEDLLKEQLIKALQLRAARAALSHPECLRLTLTSHLTYERFHTSTSLEIPTPCSMATVSSTRIPSSNMVVSNYSIF